MCGTMDKPQATTAFKSLDDLLIEQSQKLDQLTIATTLLQSKEDVSSQLVKAQNEVSLVKAGLEALRKDLEILREQHFSCLELSSMLETLNDRIIHMEQNIPPKLVKDYISLKNDSIENSSTKKKPYSSCEQKNTLMPMSNRSNCPSSKKTRGRNEGSLMKDCKKILFAEPELYPRLQILTQEEYNKVLKYVTSRQPLEVVNALVLSINEILKAKYTLLSLGKDGARKKGELDLYLDYKRQQAIDSQERGEVYFFTIEDYQRYTKSKLDKTKLNLLTALRLCKRLREFRIGNRVQYVVCQDRCD